MRSGTMFFIVLCLIFIFSVWVARPVNGDNVRLWIGTALPIITSLVITAYTVFAQVHFFINKVMAWLRGKRVKFNASSTFKISEVDYRSLFAQCVEVVDREFPKSKLQHIDFDGLQATYELDNKVLWIQVVPPDDPEQDDFNSLEFDGETNRPTTSVLFRITGGNASYFRIGNAITDYDFHIHTLRGGLQSDTESHTLEIIFDEEINPYFGLYLKQVRPANIKRFICEIENGIGDTQTFISISQYKIAFDSTTPQALFRSAKQYLNAPSTRQVTHG